MLRPSPRRHHSRHTQLNTTLTGIPPHVPSLLTDMPTQPADDRPPTAWFESTHPVLLNQQGSEDYTYWPWQTTYICMRGQGAPFLELYWEHGPICGMALVIEA